MMLSVCFLGDSFGLQMIKLVSGRGMELESESQDVLPVEDLID
jgi:hypothetical protein